MFQQMDVEVEKCFNGDEPQVTGVAWLCSVTVQVVVEYGHDGTYVDRVGVEVGVVGDGVVGGGVHRHL